MKNFVLSFFLLMPSNYGFSQATCINVYGKTVNTIPSYPDDDGDGFANSNVVFAYCPTIHDPFKYRNSADAPRYDDGQLIIDCAPNDDKRGRFVDVWPDQDQDHYAAVGSVMTTGCYGWESGMGQTLMAPADEGYTADDELYSKAIMDCDDTKQGETQSYYYQDNDNDGYGTGSPLGVTCEKNKASSPHDCNDNDPLVLAGFSYGQPDRTQCDPEIYRLSVDGKDFKITLSKSDLASSLEPSETPHTRTFKLQGIVRNAPYPTVWALNCSGENCPPWTLKNSTGVITWTNISLANLKPIEPFENGVFDPDKPAKFRVKMSVGTNFGSGYMKSEYLIIDYIPECPELLTTKGVQQIFQSGFELKNYSQYPNISSEFRFTPKCPSTGARVTLEALSKAMKIDHFNWWQSFKDASTYYEVDQSLFEDFNKKMYAKEYGAIYPKSSFKLWNSEWKIDPSLDGKSYIIVTTDPKSGISYSGSIGVTLSDSLPFYYNETQADPLMHIKHQSHTQKYESIFFDAPVRPFGWYKDYGTPKIKFLTRVAGVRADGSFVIWTSNTYHWDSDVEYLLPQENTPEYNDFAWKALPLTLNQSNKLLLPNQVTGKVQFDLVRESKMMTPGLIGMQLNEAIAKITNEGDFQVELQETVPSNLPEGTVVSQSPGEFEEVSTGSKILVKVAGGKAKNCGSVLHGQTESRTKYKAANVPFGSSCDTVKEIQSATCNDGALVFSGSAQYDSCSVLPKPTTPKTCKKTVKKVCKVGLLNSIECDLPQKVLSVKKDPKYVGSSCHKAPKKLTIWNLLQLINSYSINGDGVRVNFGCKAQFEVNYEEACSK